MPTREQRWTAWRWLTVLGLDGHVLEGQADLGRCREDLALRERQQGVHEASDRRGRAVHHVRSPAASALDQLRADGHAIINTDLAAIGLGEHARLHAADDQPIRASGSDGRHWIAAWREACIAGSDELTQAGNVLCGVALLDERDRMAGSLMIVDFADREAVDAWLQTESYVMVASWHRRQVLPVGPSFVGLHKTPARS